MPWICKAYSFNDNVYRLWNDYKLCYILVLPTNCIVGHFTPRSNGGCGFFKIIDAIRMLYIIPTNNLSKLCSHLHPNPGKMAYRASLLHSDNLLHHTFYSYQCQSARAGIMWMPSTLCDNLVWKCSLHWEFHVLNRLKGIEKS